MRSRFDEQLAQLHRELIEMGALCERVIALAAKALTTGDKALAQQVPPLDREIDRKERDIENLCLRLLLHQQPVAGDLRRISAALKMITDMERIGDQADDIAEIVLYLADVPAESHVLLQKMAEAAIGMVSDSVDAYVRQDVELAEQVITLVVATAKGFLEVPLTEIKAYQMGLLDYVRENHSEIIAALEETKALDDTLRQAILTAAEEYKGR